MILLWDLIIILIETLVQVTIPLSLLTYIGTKIFLFLFFLLFSQHIYCVTSSSIATTTTFFDDNSTKVSPD